MEGKKSAALRGIFRADLPTMRFNDGTNNGETHPHPGGLRRKEMIDAYGLKDPPTAEQQTFWVAVQKYLTN